MYLLLFLFIVDYHESWIEEAETKKLKNRHTVQVYFILICSTTCPQSVVGGLSTPN